MRISDWSSDVCSSDLPDHRLRTYMTAEVQIVLQEARDVLAIPAAALIGGGRAGGSSVQVVDAAGQVGKRPVEVGLNNKIRSEEHTSELQSLMRHLYAAFC